MASVSALRDGLKTRLSTIAGLRAYDIVPGKVEPPAAVVRLESIQFDSTVSRGSDDFVFVVLLLVSAAVDRAAQDKLDGYLDGSGATSVKTALEGDQDLDGAAQWTTVTEVRNYGLVEWAGVSYLGAEFVVRVGVLGAT